MTLSFQARAEKLRKGWSERERAMERNILDPTYWEEVVCLNVGYFFS